MSNTTGGKVRMPYPDGDDSPQCMIYERRYVNGLIDIINSRQEQVEKLQAELAERDKRIATLGNANTILFNANVKYAYKIECLESTKASAVSVPRDVYNHLASQLRTLTTAYLPHDMRKQFLSAGDPINKPESSV